MKKEPQFRGWHDALLRAFPSAKIRIISNTDRILNVLSALGRSAGKNQRSKCLILGAVYAMFD